MVKVDKIVDFEIDESKLTLTIEIDSGFEFLEGRKIKICPEIRKVEVDKKLFMRLIRELRD